MFHVIYHVIKNFIKISDMKVILIEKEPIKNGAF